MEGLFFQNPELTLLIIILVVIVGKELFLKKEDKAKFEKDMNALSNKVDNGTSLNKQEFSGAIHNLELKTSDRFGEHSEKFFEKIDAVWNKIDTKYVSKEMNKKQEERIEMVEQAISEIRSDVSEMKPYLEKIDMIYDMIKDLQNRH